MNFVIIDESTPAGQVPQYGGPISSVQLEQIANTLDLQLNRDLSTIWGGSYNVRAGAGANDIKSGEIVAALVDTLSEDGAVAYHDDQGNDVPFIQLGREMCTNIMGDAGSISSALSHEHLETIGDPSCNLWADDNQGASWAFEFCDAVEGNCYILNGVAVSDFLMPSFFGPGAMGPWSFMGSPSFSALLSSGQVKIGSYSAVSAPFTTAKGGYQIRRTTSTGFTTVWGLISHERKQRALHPKSRIRRRGVIL